MAVCKILAFSIKSVSTAIYTYNEKLVLDVTIMLRISDQLTVSILNTMLRENSATPIIAAPHNLSVDCALPSELLRSKRG